MMSTVCHSSTRSAARIDTLSHRVGSPRPTVIRRRPPSYAKATLRQPRIPPPEVAPDRCIVPFDLL